MAKKKAKSLIGLTKKNEEKIINIFTLSASALFVVWGIVTASVGNKELVFDRFYSAAICLAVYFLYKKMHLRLYTLVFAGFVLFLHHLKLYGNVYYGVIQFDMIMHFVGGLALALIFYQYFSFSHSKAWAALFAILVAAGIGSLSEIMEYIGYYFLGPGEGILFYGTGDIGEYADTAWDMICNTLGAFVGILWMLIVDKVRKKK